ncbi:MAG: hypothetical protein Q7T41_02655 [Candidatus Saccharibacteria bacterium]|nr:hypothetical protein [Candidatus Saccharibacteria bacterium]
MSKNKSLNKKLILTAFATALILLFIYITNKNNNSIPTEVKNSTETYSSSTKEDNPYECAKNPLDKCVFSPSVDLWPSVGEDSNGDYPTTGEITLKDIGGVIKSINKEKVEIDTKSNRKFTIIFPVDAIELWNSSSSSNYDDFKLGIGDPITVTYRESKLENSTTINPDQIFTSKFAIKGFKTKAEASLPIQHYDEW